MLAASLAACLAGPDYHAPPAPVAERFNAAAAAEGRLGDRPAADPDRWWAGFKDPVLEALVDRALGQNLDIAAADARLGQARARARGAGAALLPQGQASGQASWERLSVASAVGRVESAFPGFRRDQSLYDLGAGASWEPDLFGGLRRARAAARADYAASAAARAGVRLAVAAETADAYLQVRALQARLRVAEDEAGAERRLEDLTELLYARGTAARLDRDRARGARAAAEAAIPPLRAAHEAELDALEVLVGAAPGALHAALGAAAPIPAPPGVDPRGGPAALVRRRPDVIAAEGTLRAANARVGAAIAEYYPKITLSGVIGVESNSLAHLVGEAAYQPQGLVGFRWRLFDFGRVDAEVAGARGAEAEALAAYRAAVLRASADVEGALVALVERERQAAVLAEGVAALEAARGSAEAAYEAGQLSQLEVLDADTRLLAARDQEVLARAEASRSAVAAFRALGGGWS